MKKKLLVGLATGMFLAGIVGVANAAIITFDDAISGSTSYEFDGDGDGINDVTFSTTDPYGFNTSGPGSNMTYIEEPGLEGTSLLVEDLRVDFIHGAVDSLAFGFALNSYTEDDIANFKVFNRSGELLSSATITGTYTTTSSGQSNYPEGYLEVIFSGVASYATFDFTSDFGRFIIDNFSGTFGSTETVDSDGDGINNSDDNCPAIANQDQADADSDGIGNVCDACPHDPENDIDADGICGDDGGCSTIDNCPNIANPDQSDEDSDGLGDACDEDDDNDGILDGSDNCQFDANPDQADLDQDGFGDICDTDSDGDNVIDATDQCLGTASGAVVNTTGCAIEQICPCATSWKNHGGYVKCVAHAAHDFLDAGLITFEQRREYISSAARSECGHKKPKRNLRGSKGHGKKYNVHGATIHPLPPKNLIFKTRIQAVTLKMDVK